MSSADIDLSSISSTGHEDGLGRRSLSFDRETGAMLEYLYLRPELAAFERLIRERVDRLTALDDDRFARPVRMTRDTDTGELTVVSGFVSGHRVSDLLDTSQDAGLVPGVDVALGYLLEALPALSIFHSTAGCAHGLLDPGRIVVTKAGRVVLLDAAYGAAVQRLGLSRKRLWTTFGIAAPSAATLVLDHPLDISQIVLSAVMLVLGRRMEEEEYPEAIPTLLMEVVDVAQIRGSTGFAGGLQRILQRSLPLPNRRAYPTADEMIVDVRQLVRREIGVEVCRRALRDFIEQMEAAIAASTATESDSDRPWTPDEQDLPENIPDEQSEEQSEEVHALDSGPTSQEPQSASDSLDFEMRLEAGDIESAHGLPSLHFGDGGSKTFAPIEEPSTGDSYGDRAPVDEYSHVGDEPAHDDRIGAGSDHSGAPTTHDDHSSYEPYQEPVRHDARAFDAFDRAEQSSALPESPSEPSWHSSSETPVEDVIEAAPELEPLPEPVLEASTYESPLTEDTSAYEAASESPDPEPTSHDPLFHDELTSSDAEIHHAETGGDAPASEFEEKHSRRKRHQQKSARARKDKLRSTAVQQPTISQPEVQAAPAPEPPAPPKPPSKSGWLVPPDRAAAFEPQQPPVQVPQMPVMAQPPPPAMPTFAAPMPVYPPPAPIQPPQPIQPLPPPRPIQPASRQTNMPPPRAAATLPPVASSPVVKLKVEPPAGYAPHKTRRPPGPPLEPVTMLPSAQRGMFGTEAEEPRGFPWKIAIALLVLVAVGIVAGRAYLATHAAEDPTAGTTASSVPIAPEPEPAPAAAPPPKGSGQIIVRTQPAGAKVLLDGKGAGESPVTLNVAPGRHQITLITSSGSAKQTVRVSAGKSVTIDQPTYSGWLAVFAPIVLDVSEGGVSMGTTDQNRLMIAPGHHSLTLSNKDLGYSAVQEVDVTAGEVTSLTINPVGAVNFNAVPWAEVWLDGQKIGETPIANMQLPLGTREFVFKNTQFGERKATATIRGDKPAAVSVDFTK